MTDEDDHALAGRLATEAGELLVELRADAFAAGAHPWQVMDEGDMRAHHFLVQAPPRGQAGRRHPLRGGS